MCIKIILSYLSMVQYVIKIHSVKIKDIGLMQWIGVFYCLFILWQQLLCCSGSISCMWRCNAGWWMSWCFYAGISSEAFIQRLLILVFARVGYWKLIYVVFCSFRRGYCTEKFFCSCVEILIQNASVISLLIWWHICLSDGCSWSIVDYVCFVCIGEVIIGTVLYINSCTDDSTISLNFMEVRQCIFPFLCACLWSGIWT